MFSTADIIILVFLGLCIALHGFNIVKRLIESARHRRHARTHIGDEVSINQDIGAKFAYKGICHFLNGDYIKSLSNLEKAMKNSTVSHNNAFCLDWMSQCYDAQDKNVESLQCCVRAVQVEPGNIKSLFNLSDMYVRLGLFEKAEFYYNQILRYDNDNLAATFMIGTLFMSRGEYEKAEEQFQKVLEIDDKFTSALAEMSILSAFKGDYSSMDSYYERAKARRYIETGRLKKRLSAIKEMRDLCYDN